MRVFLYVIALLSMLITSGRLLPAFACTQVQIKTTRGAVVVGRSMEWGADLNSRLVVHPRQEKVVSSAPSGKAGMAWTSKYGYVGVDANGLDASVDGMNERGLSFGLLWLPGYTQYQDVREDHSSSALNLLDLGAWLLGNFGTVDEVKSALAKARVWAPDVPSFGGIPTVHFAVHDASGGSVVVEFVGGEQKVYDNPLGIMTNAPTFDWHLINLSNYLMVRADKPEPVKVAGTILSPPGQGGGFLGIPGDWTPPSRFVRTAAMREFARQVDEPAEAVNLTAHVLNAVDIPKGAVRETVGGRTWSDYTQWITIKDLGGKLLYFRSYDNLNLRMLDLNQLNFGAGANLRYLPIAGGAPAQDVTADVR